MLTDVCKVKTMLKEHRNSNSRGLEACMAEGNSIKANQKAVLHGNPELRAA
jgi:hypothetical protein